MLWRKGDRDCAKVGLISCEHERRRVREYLAKLYDYAGRDNVAAYDRRDISAQIMAQTRRDTINEIRRALLDAPRG